MKLNELTIPKKAKKKPKRVGRGTGSGHGKTSTRGHKGAKARAGKATRIGFEGGQMPLIRRTPKRGFFPRRKIDYQIVNLHSLNLFKDKTTVTIEDFKKRNLVKKLNKPVKILGKGEFRKTLIVKAQKFSKSAKEAIEKAGGKAQLI
jgi:large subunit ribosomal protein L15